MDVRHPQNVDNRPKRRKDKNNPYTIFSVGKNTGDPHYFVAFKDGSGDCVCLEVSKSLFDQFDKWELEDLSFLHEHGHHYEHSELTELTLHKRALYKEMTPEEIALQTYERNKLVEAIKSLTTVQQRRLIMHFEKGMSYKEIGEIEGCKYQAIQASIAQAYNKIKSFLK